MGVAEDPPGGRDWSSIRGPIADWLGDWTRAIGEHHEQFDGSGYPMRACPGTDIAYAGRLVAVADVFDVITAARSYKKPMTIQEGRLEITRCAGYAVRSRHRPGLPADLDR